MANYEIKFKKSVAKDLRNIPNLDVIKILEKIKELSIDPRCNGAIKLTGKELYRIRKGNYRIIYEIFDDKLVVHVIKVSHRSSVYEN